MARSISPIVAMESTLPNSLFFSSLLNLNHLADEGTGWMFLPGMLFEDTQAWWKNGPRQSPHEGIDLLFLADQSGQQQELPPQALVPPVWDGEVVAVFEDFLGNTVVVRHPVMDGQGWRLVSLYGHVRPLVGCGEQVTAGEPLSEVACGKARGSSAPQDHLHLSLGWLAPGWSPTDLSWPTLWANLGIRLIDPLPLVQPRP
ncbi:MAG: M23 family metallopeptidase [Deltaproteobacteria bacterium]|nr:M23 family metallopeptidase [Deltaproteobacteria bacterium]